MSYVETTKTQIDNPIPGYTCGGCVCEDNPINGLKLNESAILSLSCVKGGRRQSASD